jgi:hypothetical protein
MSILILVLTFTSALALRSSPLHVLAAANYRILHWIVLTDTRWYRLQVDILVESEEERA